MRTIFSLTRPRGTLSHRMGEGWGEGTPLVHRMSRAVVLDYGIRVIPSAFSDPAWFSAASVSFCC